MPRYRLALAILLAVVACETDSETVPSHGGTVVIVTTGDASTLFPPLAGAAVDRQVSEQLYDYLAAVGREMNTAGDAGFEPRLATRWTWARDSLSIAFHLDPKARWHDGKPVSAADVQFTYAIYTDGSIGSSAGSQLDNVDSVTARDSLTAVFWFARRSPLQFFDATNQMQVLPRHVFGAIPRDSLRMRASEINPVGSGRYRFVSWSRGSSIELASDTTNYRGRANIDRLIWRITPSPVSASTMLFAGEGDIYDTMRPENVKEAEGRRDVRVLSAPGLAYVFMQFNLRNALFASREMRRALSMAVDRAAMVRNVFDSLALPGIGPTVRAYPSTDPTLRQIPYDPQRAMATLDSLGWRIGRDGIRSKSGKRLTFSILTPASSLHRHRIAILLQEQLRKAGVHATIDEPDYATFSTRLSSREFDAALGSLHLGASPAAVKETWTSSAARPGGLNYGSYMNPRFDALVDSATSSLDRAASNRFYSAAYQLAIDDAPAIWLYEPRLMLGMHSRIRATALRPDAWWSGLADWHIPSPEQIARDRVQPRN
jgi:peptide/nickel transport system substrate-binding protein